MTLTIELTNGTTHQYQNAWFRTSTVDEKGNMNIHTGMFIITTSDGIEISIPCADISRFDFIIS